MTIMHSDVVVIFRTSLFLLIIALFFFTAIIYYSYFFALFITLSPSYTLYIQFQTPIAIILIFSSSTFPRTLPQFALNSYFHFCLENHILSISFLYFQVLLHLLIK
jgi:hypothetical protein